MLRPPLSKGRCSPRLDRVAGRSCSLLAAVALLFSCCCYYYCCFPELVEDVVRFGRLSRTAVTLGGRVRRLRREESRDEGHEHRKGAQRRSQPELRERG